MKEGRRRHGNTSESRRGGPDRTLSPGQGREVQPKVGPDLGGTRGRRGSEGECSCRKPANAVQTRTCRVNDKGKDGTWASDQHSCENSVVHLPLGDWAPISQILGIRSRLLVREEQGSVRNSHGRGKGRGKPHLIINRRESLCELPRADLVELVRQP